MIRTLFFLYHRIQDLIATHPIIIEIDNILLASLKMVKKEKEQQAYRPKAQEKIICEHKGLKYEARVISVRKDPNSQEKNPTMQFLVHYQGWNKSWDEWVGEGRVYQWNEVNIAIMKEQGSSQSKSRSAGSARKKLAVQQNQSNASTISSQGSVSDSIILEPEDPIQPDKEVKIRIQDELKNWLIDDDNNIKNKKLTSTPAKPSISTILKDYVLHKKNSAKGPNEKFDVNLLTLGIKDCFNVMLGPHLLYKYERLQYQTLLKNNGKEVDLTDIYGVIHLVRLFTKIGKLLAVSTLDAQNIQTLVNYIQDLQKFISKQPSIFDLEKYYVVAQPDYVKNALK